MLRRTLNLGILAHVDAGKTTLTERLLYAAGIIDELGSVDDGSTQTDSLALEQQRGITIKSAVVSFPIDGVTVNLIDTPGHPDFIAEVERVLSVLDGAVLVVSAVEGVQSQTPLLMRALQRLRVPTLLFVNKIDRRGAQYEGVLRAISERLSPSLVPMGEVHDLGARGADFTPWGGADAEFADRLASVLADRDDAILADYVDDEAQVSYGRLRGALAAQSKRGLVHPVFFGSALTGAGVEALQYGIAELLPSAEGKADGPVSGSVFKIERDQAGLRVAYVRLFSGTVRTRDRIHVGEDGEQKVTAISVFDGGSAVHGDAVSAGQIGKLAGLGGIRIGDVIGETPRRAPVRDSFAPPTLEAVVVPRDPADRAALYVALTELAEQDPLINVRRDDTFGEISTSLYGEVQKEVIQSTLLDDYGLDVEFSETSTIHVERPAAAGEALELLHAESNPFRATIGLRVEPGRLESGIDFRLEVEARSAPLYLYKNLESFTEHMDGYVRQALGEGLFGWRVTDCVVTMTNCAYSVPDGPPSRRGPLSTAADFRKLTPIVLVQALENAGTVVCEPVLRGRLEVPADSIGVVIGALGRVGSEIESQSLAGSVATIEAIVPAARMHELQHRLPALTGGEGVLESDFGGYRPVTGDPPTPR